MSTIFLRLVTEADCQLIFQWRNHEKVRRYSFHSEEISFSQHQQWFQNALNNVDHVILIAELNKQALGVFRLYQHDETAEVSIYLNPDLIGQGLGRSLLNAGIIWVKKNLHKIATLKARIMSDNMASIHIFEKCGFIKKADYYQKNMREN